MPLSCEKGVRGAPCGDVLRDVDQDPGGGRVVLVLVGGAHEVPTINTNWERLKAIFSAFWSPLGVFGEVCRVHSDWCVDQQAFAGRVSHPLLSCLR